MSDVNKKRCLPPDITTGSASPLNKKRKLNPNTALLLDKISETVEDKRTYDVVFVVGVGDNTERIHGVKFLFSTSTVLRNMLYGEMSEALNQEVIVSDVTADAFKYIQQYTHFLNPSLEYEHVIDILYAAQKYLITDIVKQCKDKITSMNDIATFYLIMQTMSKYAPSTFESVLTDILRCDYVKSNISAIVAAKDEQFNKLKRFQVYVLFQLIDNSFVRYKRIKSYCKANKDGNETWQQCFRQFFNFKEVINFNKLRIDELMNEIRKDEAMELNVLLTVIDVKIKEMQNEYKKINAEKYRMKNEIVNKQTELDKMRGKWKKRGVANAYRIKRLRKRIKRLEDSDNSSSSSESSTDSDSSSSSSD